MKRTYGVFRADNHQVISTYVADGVQLDAVMVSFPVIHAELGSWVDSTKCKLISIAGVHHAVTSVEYSVADAVSFGHRTLIKFSAENILLGITQAGMTGTVRRALSDVIQCLQTGSLYDAIASARAIPAEDKDPTFVTDARLLAFINIVEAYLGLKISESL
jgi:hypothetical protein